MENLNYSFIIPHKNSSELLKRCLDSIPNRDDLEIIVIDDNSNDINSVKEVVDGFQHAILKSNTGFGAGGARNVGLDVACGKWIVFSDADDYFPPGFLTVLDKYLDSDVEIVYHKASSVDSETYEPLPKFLNRHNGYLDGYNGSQYTTDLVKFKLHSPWWKMVRRDFLESHQIRFEEVAKGNDVFFTYQIGYYSKKIAVEKTPLYVHTYNKNGISFGKKNLSIRKGTLIQAYKVNKFYDFINHPEWKKNILYFFLEILKYDGVGLFLKVLFFFLKNHREIAKEKNQYVNSISNRM